MKFAHIKSSAKVNYEIVDFLNPQVIYIPINNNKVFFKKGDYIYKGDEIVTDINNDSIYSSVSGYVIDKFIKKNISGKETEYLMIENDYKEKTRINYGSHKSIVNYSKEEFFSLLNECGINKLINIDMMKEKNIKYLIINVTSIWPYGSCDNAIVSNYAELLLECIDAIMTINSIKYTIIAINEKNVKNKIDLSKYVGSYPNIKMVMVPKMYKVRSEEKLIKYLFNREIDKNKFFVSDISNILYIYDILKYCQPITEKIMCISGEGIKKQINIKVKIGTSLNEILSNVVEYKQNTNFLFVVNDELMEQKVCIDDVIVTNELQSVLITKNKYLKKINYLKIFNK